MSSFIRAPRFRTTPSRLTLALPLAYPALTLPLPPVMSKCFIGFRHPMYVFFLLDRGAFAVGGVEQLVGELIGHALFGAAAAIEQQPADGERGAAIGIHFDRHLIVRATDAAGLHFEQRLGVLDSLLE